MARHVLAWAWAVLLALTGGALGAATENDLVAVRLPMAQADLLAAHASGAQTLHYGAFIWSVVPRREAAAMRDAGARLDIREQPYTLRLGGYAFDPKQGLPQLPQAWAGPATGAAGSLRIVQFVGPIKASWRESLAARGAKVIRYLHPGSYVVWMPAAEAADAGAPAAAHADLATSPGVRWTGPFAPAFRAAPTLRQVAADAGRPVHLKVLLATAGDIAAVRQAAAALGARMSQVYPLDDRLSVMNVTIAAGKIDELASLSAVYAVQEVREPAPRGELTAQLTAGNVNGAGLAVPGYQAWLDALGLSGAGVIIGHVDLGLFNQHPDLVNRLAPCSGDTCAGDMSSEHGTHTAGIIAADNSSGATLGFFLRGLGMAPAAMLVEQTWVGNYNQPNGMLHLIQESRANGAVISANSWGTTNIAQGYDNDTMQVDIGVRDADPQQPGDQPMIYVLSIANGGGGISSMGAPDEAKNIIAVGASFAQMQSGLQVPDVDALSANTAHGPALDGRRLPTVVAPGCYVDSTAESPLFLLFCGTSQASPHVSGAVALFVEKYRKQFGADPSPALVRAAVAAAAKDLAGHNDADGQPLGHRPDSKQGWGRLLLPRLVEIAADEAVYIDQEVVLTATGQSSFYKLTPVNPNEPMRVFLAWTDAPGHGLGGELPAWNNDLDLRVHVEDDLYQGNNFAADGFSAPGGAADFRNNLEGIILKDPPAEGVLVEVLAANITSDGVPAVAGGLDQDFAIVALNAMPAPGFALSVLPMAAQACTTAPASFTIETTAINGFAEPIELAVSGEPAGSAAISPNPVAPGDAALLTIPTNGAASGDYVLVIEGAAAGQVKTALASLRLDAAAPGPVQLAAPADGAADVSPATTFFWEPLSAAAAYEFALDDDAGFADPIVSKVLEQSSLMLETPLAKQSQFFWRVRSVNGCGPAPWSQTFSFTTSGNFLILLVDDDDNSPNVRPSYAAALAALNQPFDVWDTDNSDAEPSAADLANYELVIWFTGAADDPACGPGAAGEAALTAFINNGGCVFISSQDWLLAKQVTQFMTEQLGLGSFIEDKTQDSVAGMGQLFAGLGPHVLDYPFQNLSDRISPAAPAGLMFFGNDGDAAIGVVTADSAAVWAAFPLEAITPTTARAEVLERMITTCITAPPPPACPEDLNADGNIDSADLNLVLAGFGFSAAGDINGDGLTNSTDLNLLLARFGLGCN